MRAMRRRLSSLILRLIGWSASGVPPAQERCVLIAAPHTSNWDLALLLLFANHFGFRLRWMGKHTLFRGPMGWLMRFLGGLPIDRRSRNNVVEQMAARFAEEPELVLVIPPEGTRRAAEYWKSGFYHIARAADVPVLLCFLDYRRKVGGIGPTLWPSGNVKADMDAIRAFYAGKTGRYAHAFGPVRLRAEDEPLAEEPAA